MGKYSEVSSTTEVNASAPCAVEFGLKANFPDDKQQTYPATNIPFKARTPQSIVEGVLDSNGEVIIQDVGIGNVTIEVLPDIDKEIEGLQKEIKVALDELIDQEKAQAQAIEDEYNKSNWIGRRGKDIASIASGIWGFIKGVFGALWAIVTGVGEALAAIGSEVGEYLLDPLNAPETFKKDVAAVKAKYEALRKFADEDLETYFIFASDEKTWDIFQTFGKEYLDAQHYSEIMEGGTEAVLGVILTIITAGAGAATAAGAAGSRLAAVASKLAPVVQKLSKAIKDRARFKRRETVQANTRVETVVVMRLRKKRVKCFCVGDHSKGGREEYDRQLKHQQDGLNNTTADEYVSRRQAYTGKDICGNGYGDGKTTARDPNVTKDANTFRLNQQAEKYTKELIQKGIDLDKAEIMGKAKAKAEVTGTEVGVFNADGTPKLNKDGSQRMQNIGGQDPLHNQDMNVGGRDMIGERPGIIEFQNENFGSSDVNRHIGTQWNGGRASDIDQQACAARANGAGDQKLNVELKACGKHNSSHCSKSRGTTHRKAVQ